MHLNVWGSGPDSLAVLRAKAVVAVALLCRLSPRWMLEFCKAKLVTVIERLAKERDDYLQVGGGWAPHPQWLSLSHL